jgi:hypothetical protein
LLTQYRDLYITHQAFWKIEKRAKFYDIYMKERKDWGKWPNSVSLEEIQKLLDFIPKWDAHFRGKDPERLLNIYNEILPIIKVLYHDRLENARLDESLMEKIRNILDKVAWCSGRAEESTDSSKILHTILPHLIVMWDRQIRKGVVGNENKKSGSVYALEFLPKMRTELLEAIDTCIGHQKLNQEEAIKYIRQTCGHETLPKLIDEHNYVIYTKTLKFRSFLEVLKETGEITAKEYERLIRRLPY